VEIEPFDVRLTRPTAADATNFARQLHCEVAHRVYARHVRAVPSPERAVGVLHQEIESGENGPNEPRARCTHLLAAGRNRHFSGRSQNEPLKYRSKFVSSR
jgi:hypothetical protein